ncbi:MAG: hypothetical protein IPK16_04055 [Anaerolineales bacterium]|nr:hypothetical protein [Anaerolineales bacterium]
MFPDLDIGPIHTATYAAAYATALFVAMLMAFHRLRRLGIDADQALWCLTFSLLLSLAWC